MSNDLRSFLTLNYEELEELNLKAKEERKNRVPEDQVREERLKYLTDEKGITDAVRRALLPLWNAWYFFSLYVLVLHGINSRSQDSRFVCEWPRRPSMAANSICLLGL